MAKTSTNITIENDLKERVDELRLEPTENRSFSNMIETLIREALEARKKSKLKKN